MSRGLRIARRFLLFVAIGVVFGALLSEIPFWLMGHTTRPPKQIVIVIPPGTADRVARGESSPSIPQDVTFVVGDTLVVKNEDSVSQQLGPLWIPPGTSASLPLNTNLNYYYQCSFVPTKVFGLNVGLALDPGTRLVGILFGGLPMGFLLAVYSLIIWPVREKDAELDSEKHV